MNELINAKPVNNPKPHVAEIHKTIEALNCHVADLVQKACYVNQVVCGASEDSIKLSCPPATITEITEIGLMQNLNRLDNMLADIDTVLDNIQGYLGLYPDEKAS